MAENGASAGKPADDALPIALGAGLLIACWDFCMMFQAWVVTTQREIVGGNIFFLFLGVMPLVGMIGSFRRKLWGPKTLVICPMIASTGFLFTVNAEWRGIVAVILLFVLPTIAIGTALLKLIRQRAQIVDAFKPETSN